MSVKLMTADAIRNDLKTIALMWPDGIPWQQLDRVNALKAELKRRGEPLDGPTGAAPARAVNSIAALTTEELEAELRSLSTRDDEASQTRFADIRFELRRRANAKPDEPAQPSRPQAAIRELELPDDAELPELVAKSEPERGILRRPTVPAPKTTAAKLEKAPSSVRGFTATARNDGSVLLEYEILQSDGSFVVAKVLEQPDADGFIAMMSAARAKAARLASGE